MENPRVVFAAARSATTLTARPSCLLAGAVPDRRRHARLQRSKSVNAYALPTKLLTGSKERKKGTNAHPFLSYVGNYQHNDLHIVLIKFNLKKMLSNG